MDIINKNTVIFFINASKGTGQFARLESAAKALLESHNVIWVSPEQEQAVNGINYFRSVKDFANDDDNSNPIELIFSSESDILRNLLGITYLKSKYRHVKITFMQRIDSFTNYVFNFKKSFSLNIFLRVISFPLIIFISSLLVNKYIFQTPFAMKDYFLKNNLSCFFIAIFFKTNTQLYILPNNSGIEWNSTFQRKTILKNKNESADNSKRKIVYIGNMQYYGKGIDTLLKAYKQLDPSLYKIIFIGKIPKQFIKKIDYIASKASESTFDIEFLGHKKTPHNFLNDSKTLYVSASRLDLCPNSLLEALEFNIPILVSDIDAHKYIIRDKKLIFSKNNANALASKASALFDNKKIWDENTNSVSESFKRFDFNWAVKFVMLMD